MREAFLADAAARFNGEFWRLCNIASGFSGLHLRTTALHSGAAFRPRPRVLQLIDTYALLRLLVSIDYLANPKSSQKLRRVVTDAPLTD